MKRSFRVTAILVMACLIFGGVGLAPEIANTTGSPVVKAAVKKYTRYVKVSGLEVHKKASNSSEVVATLKQYKKVTQYGSANSKGWVKIRYKSGEYGYVKKGSLKSKRSASEHAKYNNACIMSTVKKYNWEVYQCELKKDDEGDVSCHYSFSNDSYSCSASCMIISSCDSDAYNVHIFSGTKEIWDNVGSLKDKKTLSAFLDVLKKYAV